MATNNKTCKDAALAFLARRLYSEAELRGKLSCYCSGEVDEVVEWLLCERLLDDREFAEMIVKHYSRRGYGIKKIKNELYIRGVDGDVVSDALSGFTPDEDTLDRLIAKAGDIERAKRTLLRRGYKWDEIRNAIERNFEEEPDGWQ